MPLSMIQKLYFLFQKQIQTFENEKMSEANLRDNIKKVHLNCKIKLRSGAVWKLHPLTLSQPHDDKGNGYEL